MNWDHLRFFIALAKNHTLVKAGQALQVSHTTIYRRIKAFEEELGVLLFKNTPRGYGLTEVGEKLFQQVEGIETSISNISRELAGMDQRLSGTVTITTTDTIGSFLLPEILKKLLLKYPDLAIDLHIGIQRSNLSKREADIAVRIASSPQQTLVGRQVGVVDFAVFASDKITSIDSNIKQIKDIVNNTFILLDESLGPIPANIWLENQLNERSRILRVNNMTAAFELCRAGIGFAMLPCYLERRFSGLKKIYQPEKLVNAKIWVLTHRDLVRSERIRVTSEFLFNELRPFFIS